MKVIQVERGFVNTSALTLIRLASMEVLNTVLLDDVDRGAADPWAAAWTPDGRRLCITHAGTHELSVIDFPALLQKLAALPATPLDQLAQPPSLKRFRARIDGRDWNQKVRLLAEVSAEGRCTRVVFLSCPDGLRRWLLASLASWTFRPGEDNAGPVSAWVQVDAELRLAIGSFESGMPRLSR